MWVISFEKTIPWCINSAILSAVTDFDINSRPKMIKICFWGVETYRLLHESPSFYLWYEIIRFLLSDFDSHWFYEPSGVIVRDRPFIQFGTSSWTVKIGPSQVRSLNSFFILHRNLSKTFRFFSNWDLGPTLDQPWTEKSYKSKS